MTEQTAGALSHKAKLDDTKYDLLELGHAMTDDLTKEVWTCIDKHKEMFDVKEFCVVMVVASDCVLDNLIRRKFYGWPFLPKPRPSQTVWHYDRASDTVRMLWALPAADSMAMLSMMAAVDKGYENMARWSRWFYTFDFWKNIRKEAGIKMISEEEHLDRIREKGAQSGAEDMSPLITNPFDADRVNPQEIVDS